MSLVNETPTWPAELIDKIVSHLSDSKDLTNCSYVAKDFVQPSQRALFAEVSLSDTLVHTSRLVSLLQASPYIRFPMYAYHLNALLRIPLPNLQTLILQDDDFGGPVSDALSELLLPQITSLRLVNASIPLSVLDICHRLRSLYYRDVTDFELDVHPDQVLKRPTFPLEVLSFGQWVDPLLSILSIERFPSLSCIRLPASGVFMAGRSPVGWIGGVLQKFASNLTFLDLDVWDVEKKSPGPPGSLALTTINLSQMTKSHPFFIGHYPHLQCLRLVFQDPQDMPSKLKTLRMKWISKLFRLLKDPHPLRIVIFAPSTVCSSKSSRSVPTAQTTTNLLCWEQVDRAMTSSQYYRLDEVIVSLGEGRFDSKDDFRKALVQLEASGRLSFREVDFEELFYASRLV
ncbi:hypothetical protein DL96DRAFT_1623155 [Flagelloscypha sp. PMI_526]|nr:hypothetical protein DL96DRAFT_1623155 [Flagelloscypha sp. PMI_526]